jgi:hypothetical protein
MTSRRLALCIVPLLAFPALASAQDPRIWIAPKVGVTTENSEDNLKGTVPAFGLTADVPIGAGWSVEGELWVPGYLDDARGEPRHRDIVFGVSAKRMFRAGRVQPYLLAGFSLTRTQDWFTFCTAERSPGTGGPAVPTLVSCDEPDVIDRRRERNDGQDGYALAGAGVELPLSRRVRLVADLRVSLAPVSILVRPSVGVAFGF